MPDQAEQARLRIRLASASLRRLKSRALNRGSSPAVYADLIFRYALHEKMTVRAPQQTIQGGDEVYLELEIPELTKRKLSEQSEKARVSLATFSGQLVGALFEKFERDPRDLAMIHYASSLLDQKTVLSEAELRQAISRCEHNPELRLPPGYLAKWLFGRLSPLIAEIDRAGQRVGLSVGMIEHILASIGNLKSVA